MQKTLSASDANRREKWHKISSLVSIRELKKCQTSCRFVFLTKESETGIIKKTTFPRQSPKKPENVRISGRFQNFQGNIGLTISSNPQPRRPHSQPSAGISFMLHQRRLGRDGVSGKWGVRVYMPDGAQPFSHHGRSRIAGKTVIDSSNKTMPNSLSV